MKSNTKINFWYMMHGIKHLMHNEYSFAECTMTQTCELL